MYNHKFCFGDCQKEVLKSAFSNDQASWSSGKFPRCKACVAAKAEMRDEAKDTRGL